MNTMITFPSKSHFQMSHQTSALRNLRVAAFLCLGPHLFGGGTAWVGYPAKQATGAAIAPGKKPVEQISQSFTAPQSPDTMVAGGKVIPLPDGKAPLPRDTRGEAIDTGSVGLNGTTVYEHIGINRVVSYLTNADGILDPSVFSSGVISANARLTIIVNIVGSARDYGKPVKVIFTSLNGNNLTDSQGSPLQFTFILGQNYFEKLNPVSVPSNLLHYGIPSPNLNPLQTSAYTIIKYPDSYRPTPGKNELDYSFYSSLTRDQTLLDSYTAYVYSYLEFDTLAPIILVHGTNASHTSWSEPKSTKTVVDPDPLGGSQYFGLFDPFVTSPDGGTPYFDFPETPTSAFKGVWFSYIDLGLTSGGNDGIAKSADELMDQMFGVFYSLGSRTCHLVAHSKGGTDSRMLLLNYGKGRPTYFTTADDINPHNLEHRLKVLSLYTIGTPHMGTPLSDIADQISPYTNSNLNTNLSVIVSPDLKIGLISNLTNLIAFVNPVLGVAPKGEARSDQRVSSETLTKLRDNDYSKTITNGHTYNIIGDADLDKTGDITGNETTVVDGLGGYPNFLLDINYYIVGTIGSILVKRYGPYLEVIPQEQKSPTREPNDWVSPFWGAQSPGAIPFQVNGITRVASNGPSNWTPPSGTSPSNNLNYATTLSPGNHSILKSAVAAARIVQNILLDYPIQDPMSQSWR